MKETYGLLKIPNGIFTSRQIYVGGKEKAYEADCRLLMPVIKLSLVFFTTTYIHPLCFVAVVVDH